MTETEIIKEKKRNIYSSFFSEDYVSKFLFKSILHHVISLEIYENNKLHDMMKTLAWLTYTNEEKKNILDNELDEYFSQ